MRKEDCAHIMRNSGVVWEPPEFGIYVTRRLFVELGSDRSLCKRCE